MTTIARQSIEQIRASVNIYDIVLPVVKLKQSGKSFVGLSPFTNEKTPSFYVHPERNFFKCFSSGEAGDIFKFVELTEKLPFHEAVETIARRHNIALEYERGHGPSREERTLRAELLEIHDHACDYYHRTFKNGESASTQARQYWVEARRFPLELAESYKIGFAPPKDTGLLQLLIKKGFSLGALKQCGLFYYRDRESSPRNGCPRFRGRLMIPIRDHQQQVVAFTARQLPVTPQDDPTAQAKYINSPETPIFHKSNLVFGLDHARQHVDAAGQFILVEGQLDALRCWQHGFGAAVAPQGTAITEQQLALLRRYTSRICCILDGDRAGHSAAQKLLPLALKANMEVCFALLPDESDPDSLLLNQGPAAFAAIMDRAQDEIPFAFDSFIPDTTASPQSISTALARLYELFAESGQTLMLEAFWEYVGQRLRLRPKALAELKNQLGQKYRYQQDNVGNQIEQQLHGSSSQRLTTAEYELFSYTFHHEEEVRIVSEIVDVDWIDTKNTPGVLLCRVLADMQEGLWQGIEAFADTLETEEERNCYYSATFEQPNLENPVETINACIKAIVTKHVDRERDRIRAKLATISDESPEFQELRQRSIDLRKLKQSPPRI